MTDHPVIVKREEPPEDTKPEQEILCKGCGNVLLRRDGKGLRLMGKDLTLMQESPARIMGMCPRCKVRFDSEV